MFHLLGTVALSGIFKTRTKTVTRRLGWKNLKPGQILNACVKCMGLKPGETIQRLGQIRVVSVRQERLDLMIANPEYGNQDAANEGFLNLTGHEFVMMFCAHMRCRPADYVTRIEFEYVDGEPGDTCHDESHN